MKSPHRPAQRRAERAGGGAREGKAQQSRPRGGASGPGVSWGAEPLWKWPALWSGLAAILLFLPTLRFEFVWDDVSLIAQNPSVRGSAPLSRLLLSDFWAASRLNTGFWRPAVSLSYWLDQRIFHGSPAGFHAMNVAGHAVASALVAILLTQVGLPRVAALLGGLWFAWLPAHVESVAFISGRTDVYSATFLLLAFVLDRRARHAGRRWAGVGALSALALALLSKEVAIAFVPLVALAEWVEVGRARIGESLRWLTPSSAVCAVYLAVHALLLPAPAVLAGVDPAMTRGVWLGTWLEFPRLLAFLWPWISHAPGPVIHIPSSFASPEVVASVLFQALFVVVIAILAARRSPLALPLALVWLPFLPLTFAGLARGRLLFAERFIYLPSIGVAWIIGIVVGALVGARGPGAPPKRAAPGARLGWRSWIGIGAVAGLILGGLVASALALPAWRDERALFGTIAATRPQNAAGHFAWGKILAHEGKLDEALEEVRAGRALGANLELADQLEGLVEIFRGNWEHALVLADRALAADSSMEESYLIRGKALMELGRYAEAGAMLQPMIREAPEDVALGAQWGRWLLLQDRADEALPYLKRAANDPRVGRDAEVHYELGMARARQGRMGEARLELRRAVVLDPRHYNAWLRLALASFTLGDRAGYEAALARAAALPQAADGRVELLRRQVAEQSRPAAPNPR